MFLTKSTLLMRLFNWWRGARIIRSGPGHQFEGSNARLRNTKIEFYGRDAKVELGNNVRLFNCSILMRGKATKLVIGAETRLRQVHIVVEDDGSRLTMGRYCSMTGARLQVMEGGLIEIGRGCMLGNGVEVNNSDSHSVINATTMERINPARDVILDRHVWIGAGVWVSKGSRIGRDSIVAARSRVVGELPAGVLAAGSPAVIKRTGVSWSRSRSGEQT